MPINLEVPLDSEVLMITLECLWKFTIFLELDQIRKIITHIIYMQVINLLVDD